MEVFVELSLILGLTVLVSALMRLLRQPLIIGYIITGILVSPYFLNLISYTEVFAVFSHIGVALLLFIVGLSLSPKIIKEVGKVSLITGVGQILFTSILGFVISLLLGFSIVASLYIGVALTFSSTIIIMKLLSDKGDLDKLYGKISIGFLLVQDMFVVFLLMVVPSLVGTPGTTGLTWGDVALGFSIIALLAVISIRILPKLSRFFAKSHEFLFLFAIGWGLCLATLFYHIGFSMEMGALIAGVALSISPYRYEISSKLRPLRDFFIILFFIYLGSQMTFGDISNFILPAIIFSLFILIGNPLVVIVLMSLMGYKTKTSFQAGLTVAQISEFSLILVSLGVTLGHLTKEILSLVTVIGLITIACSTYFILYSDRIYPYLAKYLSIFETRKVKEKEKRKFKDYPIVLFGCNRIGYDFLRVFEEMGQKFLVVDHDPDIIAKLCEERVDCVYADVDDEFLSGIDLSKLKLVVSTIPDFDTNMLLITKIRQVNKKAIILVVAYDIDDAESLYEAGATYVIMPHFLGSQYSSMLIKKYGLDIKKFAQERNKHRKYLKLKKRLGHQHPKAEKHR